MFSILPRNGVEFLSWWYVGQERLKDGIGLILPLCCNGLTSFRFGYLACLVGDGILNTGNLARWQDFNCRSPRCQLSAAMIYLNFYYCSEFLHVLKDPLSFLFQKLSATRPVQMLVNQLRWLTRNNFFHMLFSRSDFYLVLKVANASEYRNVLLIWGNPVDMYLIYMYLQWWNIYAEKQLCCFQYLAMQFTCTSEAGYEHTFHYTSGTATVKGRGRLSYHSNILLACSKYRFCFAIVF